MKRIDFHTHIFPEDIAPYALMKLSEGGGGLPCHTYGTPRSLIESMMGSGIEYSVAMNIATTPEQQHNVNDFAAYVNGEDIVCFGSVHPDAPDALSELDRIRELGLVGVKFHLDCQGFEYDHPALKKIYEKIVRLGLMVCFHTGWDLSTGKCSLTPANLLKTLPMLEGVPVIAAHFGAYGMLDKSFSKLCGQDLFFDTSFSCGRVPLPLAEKIIKKHGADRILFGTDSPWGKPQDEIKFIELLHIQEEDKEKIFFRNAEKLLHGKVKK